MRLLIFNYGRRGCFGGARFPTQIFLCLQNYSRFFLIMRFVIKWCLKKLALQLFACFFEWETKPEK